MTIIEYAEKLGYKLNSAQMMLLNKFKKRKNVICNCLLLSTSDGKNEDCRYS